MLVKIIFKYSNAWIRIPTQQDWYSVSYRIYVCVCVVPTHEIFLRPAAAATSRQKEDAPRRDGPKNALRSDVKGNRSRAHT